MHKLDRSSVPAPSCLPSWDYTQKTWQDFTNQGQDCKRQVRLALQRIQGQQIATDEADDEAVFVLGLRCAYCESAVRHGGHLEHFRRKNRSRPDGYPELTFVWENLLLACDSQEHCGHYKDRSSALPYDPAELIKPDVHDPDAFLYFHSSGSVLVRNTRPAMTDEDRRRGAETIRVFNLDCGTLQGTRRQVLKFYRDKNPGVLDFLMTCDDAAFREEYIRAEIEATRWEPHSTVIKHYFEKAA
jgi:uncharacterized protein (TIGR02646 family)